MVGAARDNDHWSLADYKGTLGRKWVVEDVNDHSAVLGVSVWTGEWMNRNERN